MTGEAWGHGPERSSWHDAGFDSMINFDFQHRAGGDWKSIDGVYRQYAGLLGKRMARSPATTSCRISLRTTPACSRASS